MYHNLFNSRPALWPAPIIPIREITRWKWLEWKILETRDGPSYPPAGISTTVNISQHTVNTQSTHSQHTVNIARNDGFFIYKLYFWHARADKNHDILYNISSWLGVDMERVLIVNLQ